MVTPGGNFPAGVLVAAGCGRQSWRARVRPGSFSIEDACYSSQVCKCDHFFVSLSFSLPLCLCIRIHIYILIYCAPVYII